MFQFVLLSTNKIKSSFPLLGILLQQTQRCAAISALEGALKPRQFASADAPTTSNGTVRTIGRIGTSAVQALPHAERMPC